MFSDDLFGEHDEQGGGDALRDIVMLLFSVVVVCLGLAFAHISLQPKAAKDSEKATPPGNVSVEINWPPGMDADVDLWVRAPGDVPVGYSNKGGAVFNLLRDDLGHQLDLSGINFENSFTRGIVPGKYIVNVHLYRNRAGNVVVPVTVVVTSRPNISEASKQILVTKAELKFEGHELTVFRFDLTEDGNLVSGSVDSYQESLRSASK